MDVEILQAVHAPPVQQTALDCVKLLVTITNKVLYPHLCSK